MLAMADMVAPNIVIATNANIKKHISPIAENIMIQ